MKCKCGNDTFRIEEISDCSTCIYNGAWHEAEDNGNGGYIYDEVTIKEKGLSRNEAEDSNQCAFGDCYNEGCYMFTCACCGKQTNLPLVFD